MSSFARFTNSAARKVQQATQDYLGTLGTKYVPPSKDFSQPNEAVVVGIIGTETGGGRYKGTILSGASTGNTSNNFQLQSFPSQSATDGPAPASGLPNNALVCNLTEPAVNGSHILYAAGVPKFYTVGKYMGMTQETTPRKIVYINDWPLYPCIAKISGPATSSYGGTYYGRMVQGQFASGTTLGSAFPLASLASGYLPSVDNCWITNNWEQTYGGTRWSIPTGTYVWGMMAGFPLYSFTGSFTWFQVYTWFVPQSAALAHPIQPLATSQSPGATYTTNEQTMLTNLKTDVSNLRASLNDFYTNMQAAGSQL